MSIVVQGPVPWSEYWKVPVLSPEPASLAVEVSVSVPESGLPGLSIVADGAVLSTRRLMTGDEFVVVPAPFVTTTRRS